MELDDEILEKIEALTEEGNSLVEDDRLDPEGQAARSGEGRVAVRLRERGVQSDSVAEIAAAAGLTRETCLYSASQASPRHVERPVPHQR